MTLDTNHGKYARPTVNYIFKRVFGTEQNKSCLISFLNSMLSIENEKLLEELQMTDKSFDKAVSALEVAKMTPAEKRAYEARLAFISDELSRIAFAKKSGLKEGLEKGLEKGRQEGVALGIHQEKIQTLMRISQRKFADLSSATISKIFMLSDTQLDQQTEFLLSCSSKAEFEKAIADLPSSGSPTPK